MGCKHKANEADVKTKKFRSGLKELPLQIAQFPEPQQPTERKKKEGNQSLHSQTQELAR